MSTDTLTETTTDTPTRVLVVDDERSMRELLSIVLKRDGHEVLVAEDGARAIEVPGSGGMERVNASRPRTVRVPVA